MRTIGQALARAMLENWRKEVAANPNPERFIDCCEWCGKDCERYGRWELRSGEGLRVVLCTICAYTFKPSPYLETHNYPQQVVKVGG